MLGIGGLWLGENAQEVGEITQVFKCSIMSELSRNYIKVGWGYWV